MNQLGQSSEPVDWSYVPPNRSETTDLIGTCEGTQVGLRAIAKMVGEATPLGGLTTFGARAAQAFKVQKILHHATSASVGDSSFHLGTSVPPQLEPPVHVSDEAERFARARGLWGSLVMLKSLILKGTGLLLGVNVNLVPDAEVSGQFAISFRIRTNANVSDVLDFDEKIRELAYDQLPMHDQIHFVVQFEFA
jgi:hypothetical protein